MYVLTYITVTYLKITFNKYGSILLKHSRNCGYIIHVYRVFMRYNAYICMYIIMLLPCKGVAHFIMVYNPNYILRHKL